MSKLFETTTLRNLELDNRFVRSATWLGMADQEGACTPGLIDVMTKLAQGGLGLILTGVASVLRGGQSAPLQLGCYDDRLLPGLTEMVQSVHSAGGKIALQIGHGGVFSSSELTGKEPLGPSPMPTEQGPLGRAMTQREMQDVVGAFTSAATRAVQAGFDGVQLHAAHGYLLSQFLSPFFNKRTDAYGGSLENRARLLMQVVEGVRQAVGNRPLFVKLNSEDCLEGGLTNQEMLSVCTLLQTAGVDAIELSGGTILGLVMHNPEISFSPVGDRLPYWRQAAEQYKAQIDLPLILVGGIRSFETAQELVDSGVADHISLCRPLIREPGLVKRWQAGDTRKSGCIADNACVMAGIHGKGVHCVHLNQKPQG